MQVRAPVWSSPGTFAVKAAGTAYYREALSHLAQNRPGEPSSCFFVAILFPDNNNPHDEHAVAVMTQEGHGGPAVLGHLPRELARLYRARMEEVGYTHQISACGAALTQGVLTEERAYGYVLELDIDLDTVPRPDNEISPPKTIRFPGLPSLKQDDDGAYRFRCWLPYDAIGRHHRKLRTIGWTAPHWQTINYYLQNDRGIGLGYKLLTLAKTSHAKVFGEYPVVAVVEALEGRWVTLRLEPADRK